MKLAKCEECRKRGRYAHCAVFEAHKNVCSFFLGIGITPKELIKRQVATIKKLIAANKSLKELAK